MHRTDVLVYISMYFAQKYPQNAGNAVPETQILIHFRGECPRTPLQLYRHYGLPSLNPGYATGPDTAAPWLIRHCLSPGLSLITLAY